MRVVDPSFGVRLREVRTARGLSLRDLSALCYLSKSQISEYENGRRRPSFDIASTLDDALNANGELSALVTETRVENVELISAAVAAPRQINAEQVDALASALALSRHLDDSLPASALLPSVEGQLATVQILARDARGPAAHEMQIVAAEFGQFAGWLNCQVRNDKRAESLLSTAARDAMTLNAPDLASQCHNFRGAVERRKGNARGIARWFMAAYETPGTSDLHRVDAAIQAVHGMGLLGDHKGASALLATADDLTTALDGKDDVSSPVAYWLTPSWLRLPLGLAYLGLGNYANAADNLRTGLEALPDGWQNAEWSVEYREALALAEGAE
ncbi:helix-turn-helix transcriptional regulator [Nocardioides sp. KC13]|uniref:Helix-turn-helix transcriptional regulator n=1 Tax=Nocardioides turkmenicus TaxID=2711220 RepID=A0A6M1QXR9_9ACTN|nr:helix-turn-helix transcriptional regulator [Nocardioides sp. KC13]NGN92626.1 helix-turn-helix transcriptional regulator [Nocardioides sp. KC13]